MNEHFGPGDLFGEDLTSKGGAAMESLPRVNDAIRSLLYEEWVDQEPSAECFDRSPFHMSVAYSLISGDFDSSEAQRGRDHLLSCSRCQFIYGRLRDETQGLSEAVPPIVRDHLHSDGSVVFPGGEVAEETWEFGILDELPHALSESIVTIIADKGAEKLEGQSKKGLILVCFGIPMHRCGKRLAAVLSQSGAVDIHVVLADDFFNPKLWCDPKELRGRRVVLFVDVVHSGGLLRRLGEAARMAEPQELIGLTVIDQLEVSFDDFPLIGMWKEPPERRRLHIFEAEEVGESTRFFDATTGRALARSHVTCEVSNGKNAQETIQQYLRELGPLFQYIEDTNALQSDKVIGGVSYPWVVDILRLLDHEEAKKELVRRAKDCLKDLAEVGNWCLVYPAERSKRAGAWARAIGEELGWRVIGIGLSNRRNYRPLTTRQRAELSKYSGAVVIDAAIRTGKTVRSFAQLLNCDNTPLIKTIAAFYAFDGLFADARREVETAIESPIRSLFRLPLGAPTDSVGKHCRRYFSEALQLLDTADSGAPWVEVVKSYCRKKMAPRRFPIKQSAPIDSKSSLLRAVAESKRGNELRLQQSCVAPRPSTVKQLDVSYALREPRTRSVLHGFLCNSMPNEFIEWCALALSTQNDFAWFDKDWLELHKRILNDPESDRWQFLAFIGYRMKQHGDSNLLARAQKDVDTFRRSQGPFVRPLIPDADDQAAPVEIRCNLLLEVLS